jgi:hypothetical protein
VFFEQTLDVRFHRASVIPSLIPDDLVAFAIGDKV